MDDRSAEERIALWLEAEAEGHFRDELLTVTFAATRSMRHRARPSGWRTILMPRSVPTFAVGAAALIVVAVLAWNVLPLATQTGAVGSSPTASPTASPTVSPTASPTASATAAPSPQPTPLPRPSAVVDSATAREVAGRFQDLMNAGRIQEAADLVWVGATIGGRPTSSRDDVIAALQTICGATFADDSESHANEVMVVTLLTDRPGYACPSAGDAYGARFTVENALIVSYYPRAQPLR